MWRNVPGARHDDMRRSSDVWAARNAAESGRSMSETPACHAHHETRTSGVRACRSAGGWFSARLFRRAAALTKTCFTCTSSGISAFAAPSLHRRSVAILRGNGSERGTFRKKRFAAALSRRFCTSTSSSAPCSAQQIPLAAQRHEHPVRMPSARLGQRCFGALGESSAKLLAPSADRLIVTATPRSSHTSSTSRRLRLPRKPHRPAQLMTMAGKLCP
ncbi:hypothetical protein OKW33_006126 [Paraburkholderia atlantica]